MTNRAKGYPFEVAFPEGFQVTGVVLADQIRSVSWEFRETQFWCKAPHMVLEEVSEKIGTLLQI